MAFGKQSRENLRRSFALQFEPNGIGYLYRRDRRGPALRLSVEEREDFVSGYARAVRVLSWSIVVGILAVFGVLAAMGIEDGPVWHRIGVTAVVAVGFMAAHTWIWYAPARVLSYRVPSAPAAPPEDRRALFFARLEYPKLALGLVAAPFMVWSASRVTDILHGWGRLWILAAVALILLVLIQAFRKWRYERTRR